jgi:hypothetical protein
MKLKHRDPTPSLDETLANELAQAKLRTDEDVCIRTLHGCLENLVKELRAQPAMTGRLGFKVSAAIATSERALKRYPLDD